MRRAAEEIRFNATGPVIRQPRVDVGSIAIVFTDHWVLSIGAEWQIITALPTETIKQANGSSGSLCKALHSDPYVQFETMHSCALRCGVDG